MNKLLKLKTIKNFNIKNITKNTLVIFDLDNTVIMPSTHVGSDSWFINLMDLLHKNHMPGYNVEKVAVKVYNQVQTVITIKLVENEIKELIDIISSLTSNIIGLTARNPSLKKITEKNLKSLGIEFQTIIYTASGHKGSFLTEFLEDRPEIDKILFIDDKVHHCKEVLESMKVKGIKTNSYHYTYLEEGKK